MSALTDAFDAANDKALSTTRYLPRWPIGEHPDGVAIELAEYVVLVPWQEWSALAWAVAEAKAAERSVSASGGAG